MSFYIIIKYSSGVSVLKTLFLLIWFFKFSGKAQTAAVKRDAEIGVAQVSFNSDYLGNKLFSKTFLIIHSSKLNLTFISMFNKNSNSFSS
jgi:hypothetical protein